MSSDSDEFVKYYRWDFKRLDHLFSNKSHGRTFKNAVFSLWLQSVTDYISNLDSEIMDKKITKPSDKISDDLSPIDFRK